MQIGCRFVLSAGVPEGVGPVDPTAGAARVTFAGGTAIRVVLRKDEKATLRQRVSNGVMTGGVVLLLGALVGAFVVVPVLLIQASRRKEADEAEALRRAEAKEEKKPVFAESSAGKPAAKPEAAPAKAPEPARPPRNESQQISVAPQAPPAPPAPAPKDAQPVDAEGFIRHWLVLAPIRSPQPPFSGAQEVHKSQIPNESRIRPKEGDRQLFAEKERLWVKHAAPEYFVDFQKIVGAGRSDDAIAYAVCYVHAPQALPGLKLQMGSNDQAKVYLNGAHLLVVDKSRTLAKDQSTANDIQLQRGENLLVFKVVNEKGGWSGCVRFIDRNNQPIKAITISLSPQ